MTAPQALLQNRESLPDEPGCPVRDARVKLLSVLLSGGETLDLAPKLVDARAPVISPPVHVDSTCHESLNKLQIAVRCIGHFSLLSHDLLRALLIMFGAEAFEDFSDRARYGLGKAYSVQRAT